MCAALPVLAPCVNAAYTDNQVAYSSVLPLRFTFCACRCYCCCCCSIQVPRKLDLCWDAGHQLLRAEADRHWHVHGAQEPGQPVHHPGRLRLLRQDLQRPHLGMPGPHGGQRSGGRGHRPALQRLWLRLAAAQLPLHQRLCPIPQRRHGQGVLACRRLAGQLARSSCGRQQAPPPCRSAPHPPKSPRACMHTCISSCLLR